MRKRVHKNVKTEELTQLRVAHRKKSDRKEESFGDEVDGLVAEVVAKRGNPDAQECGGWQDCGDLSVKIKTQFTGWIRSPLRKV
jgi:hypothetical protein